MTTVTIGKNIGRNMEAPAENTAEYTEKMPEADFYEEREETPESAERSPYVSGYAAGGRTKRKLPLRTVLAVQIVICAAAGLFVWLGTVFGPPELRDAVVGAVRELLNG